ncbi:MAG: DNA-binding response regulator [Spirochaetae bacterium HGW-Spirochaetae-3]|jgi:DNA-binding NarL/FixJ family response regulator|nr:MAG: DNA-binding response regulator [Spirochaetae bacterium HGW-Spirochaetae-3]
MIRVLIADDQRLFGESLSTTLRNSAKDIDVVGLAANGAEAVALAAALSPDVILMDVFMPVMDGVKATERVMEASPGIRILMLSTYDEDDRVKHALALGAAGYLLKDISPLELIASIRALMTGVVQISPQIVAKLMQAPAGVEQASAPAPVPAPAPEPAMIDGIEWFDSLTGREREVFSLIAAGYDNPRIAAELRLAEHTVRNLVSAIYAKLEVKDRFQIIRMANKFRARP